MKALALDKLNGELDNWTKRRHPPRICQQIQENAVGCPDHKGPTWNAMKFHTSLAIP